MRNETDNKTHWDTTNNNTRLDDRVIAIDNWKTTLERTLKDLDLEIDALTMAKKVMLNREDDYTGRLIERYYSLKIGNETDRK